jgi:hypothetical protein
MISTAMYEEDFPFQDPTSTNLLPHGNFFTMSE